MRSSNPVLTRLTPQSQTAPSAGYGSPYQTVPAASPVVAVEDRMTIDDVVVRTVGLLAVLALAGIATAALVPWGPRLAAVWMGGLIAGLILGFVITFKRITSPPLILTYAVVQGAFLGAVSKYYEHAFQGIVLQAAIATFGIFFVMAALYRARVIRATPRFTRGLIGALGAAMVLIVVRFLLELFGVHSFLSNGGPVAIVISLVIIVIGALTFILDF
ncbi:MAG TPA: Bax inhibitor-1/YccA family protein, partial [Micromonosporaceae bacterium]